MKGQINIEEVKKVLTKYVDRLNDGEDKIDLLDLLQEASHLSNEHKEIFHKALLAQMVYYQDFAEAREPLMLAKFEENMRKIDESRSTETIWEYFNRLFEQNGMTWKGCLLKIGANVKYASQIAHGQWSLMRFRSEDLAQIAAWVNADPSEIMRLSYEELQKQKRTDSLGAAAHFRAKSQRWEDKRTKQEQEGNSDEELEFIAKLDEALDALFLD